MACVGKARKPDVPLEVLMQRRDLCRQCEHATRSHDPRFAVNKGLTNRSTCREMKRRKKGKAANIARGTGMAAAACPLGHWGKWPPTIVVG